MRRYRHTISPTSLPEAMQRFHTSARALHSPIEDFILTRHHLITLVLTLSIFLSATGTGTKRISIAIQHFNHSTRTIHIPARCHLLPSSKEGGHQRALCGILFRHFSTWEGLHGVQMIDLGRRFPGVDYQRRSMLEHHPPVHTGHIITAAASETVILPRHQSYFGLDQPNGT